MRFIYDRKDKQKKSEKKLEIVQERKNIQIKVLLLTRIGIVRYQKSK